MAVERVDKTVAKLAYSGAVMKVAWSDGPRVGVKVGERVACSADLSVEATAAWTERNLAGERAARTVVARADSLD